MMDVETTVFEDEFGKISVGRVLLDRGPVYIKVTLKDGRFQRITGNTTYALFKDIENDGCPKCSY